MKTNKLPAENIHTHLISDSLGVSTSIALKVQKIINENYDLDWSEADIQEIKLAALWALEELNVEIDL
jgi:hypothetical protein